MNLAKEAKSIEDKLVEYRRHLHMNPELGFEEYETQKYICEKLDALGIEYKKYAKTGVVGTVVGNGDGKRIMIRADIDALPMQEQNDVEYKSRNDGKMHACGHDTHTSILLGVAELINNHRSDFKGTVDLLFQPAEEGPGGATPMIEDGAIGNPPHIDAAIALHIGNFFKAGIIGYRDGPFTGSADEIYITINGKSGHASAPHETVDPVYVAAQLYVALQGWLTRTIDPVEPVVLTMGKFVGGERQNIISDKCIMEGTLRTLNEEVRNKIKSELSEFANNIAKAYGATADVKIIKGYYVGVNDAMLNKFIVKSYSELFDSEGAMEMPKPVLGAEDFYHYGLGGKIPVSMFWLDGKNEEKGFVAPNHSSQFDIDESVLYIGSATLAASAISFLND